MKIVNRLLIASFVLFGCTNFIKAQTQEEPIKPMAEFNITTYDFGKIKQDIPAKATFKVKNTSLVPLIITNVKTSCGCTVANYPKDPIKPGEKGEIIATYNAKALGQFSKTVTVYTNAAEPQTTLIMKGEVIAAATEEQKTE